MTKNEIQAVLQKEWDDNVREFIEGIPTLCECEVPHTAAGVENLWLDLDDCSAADSDGGINFAYGYLMGISKIADALHIHLVRRFPVR
jgi:hypothetical protein